MTSIVVEVKGQVLVLALSMMTCRADGEAGATTWPRGWGRGVVTGVMSFNLQPGGGGVKEARPGAKEPSSTAVSRGEGLNGKQQP